MASKVYTAQEMREMANYNDSAYAKNPEMYSSAVSSMLRQAADALERDELILREIKKIDTMEVAPLDGHPIHQTMNTEKVAAVLEFFPKVKEILRGAKSLEREEKRVKKYEYATIKSDKTQSMIHDDGYVAGYHVFRREVGEWEEVK